MLASRQRLTRGLGQEQVEAGGGKLNHWRILLIPPTGICSGRYAYPGRSPHTIGVNALPKAHHGILPESNKGKHLQWKDTDGARTQAQRTTH